LFEMVWTYAMKRNESARTRIDQNVARVTKTKIAQMRINSEINIYMVIANEEVDLNEVI